MLKEIQIKNYKSILDDTISLGRVSVFIGENGSGKSNILEAVQFASLAQTYPTIDADLLHLHGIRVGKPSLMLSSFKDIDLVEKIEFNFSFSDSQISHCLIPDNFSSISAKWMRFQSSVEDYFDSSLMDEHIDILVEKTMEFVSAEDNEQLKDYKKEIRNNIINDIKNKLHSPNNKPDFKEFLIYTLNTEALRGIPEFQKSRKGLYGETLDMMIQEMSVEEREELNQFLYTISWLDEIFIDDKDELRHQGFKLNFSKSLLYFKDRFMAETNNVFSSENSNEGVLHVLFYLAHLISSHTPSFFAIDNIETSLNPHLCRHVMEEICRLAKEKNKQVMITTHNPAILDGLNLFDDDVRLFEVFRTDRGDTRTRRIALKPEVADKQYKLSELWTRGFLGAISENF